MKRTTMKNAPDLTKAASQPRPASAPSAMPASPVLGDLSRRISGMNGNTITLPVCGREVKFTLETVPAGRVERATMVWAGNERDQQLLNTAALDDLIPSFLTSGQQNPAFGRRINGVIEVADGSRRRMAAIITDSEYRVLIGELDETQMAWLSQIGNDYRPTSAYERGKRYARRLDSDFNGNVSKLAEAECISRKIIMRCMRTAELPREIVGLFSNPNELSARAGEALAKAYEAHPEAMMALTQRLARRRKSGEDLETDDVLAQLHAVGDKPAKPAARERVFGAGVKAKYRGDVVSFQLSKAPADLLKKIETLLEQHQAEQLAVVSSEVDKAFSEADVVVTCTRAAAASIGYDITSNELLSMIPFARTAMRENQDEEKRMGVIAAEINRRYVL
ncbi:ParB/RepB/Spo0J family plasmid partition protein [Atlantibacter sp.]|uniref:ParB/RepB/Spo0J family plasmid partition protein n=1 Tax=Atlantibacter sp. TaxID=1903473 RepID=UPI003917515C